jgi:hypothetical protein
VISLPKVTEKIPFRNVIGRFFRPTRKEIVERLHRAAIIIETDAESGLEVGLMQLFEIGKDIKILMDKEASSPRTKSIRMQEARP